MRQRESVRTSFVLLLVTVIVVAANLRPTVQGVGALIEQIGPDTGLSTTLLGVLGATPLLMYALVSPFAHGLSLRFGMNRTMLVSLLLLAVATVVRSLDVGLWALWVGSIATGAAIAVANVLIPAVVKHWFPDRVSAIMPVYAAILAGTGAVASGLVVPISYLSWSDGLLGWRSALLATGMLIPVAIILWIVAIKRTGPDREEGEAPRARGIWRDRIAWLVAAYMAFQSTAFYIFVTWLSPLSISYDTDEVTAGIEVMIMQLAGILGSLAVPLLLRGWGRRWVPALMPIPLIVGVIGIMVSPHPIWLWAAIFGFSSGAMMAIAVWLMADRARGRNAATALSGMAQTVGYAVAAVGPVAFAALHTATQGWTVPLLISVACGLGLLIVGFLLRDHAFVLDREAQDAPAE